MRLKSLEFPDDFADVPAWLDGLIVSPDLIDTIIELEVAAGKQLTDSQTLDSACGKQLPKIIAGGLSCASESTSRNLLRQPTLLLELQEQVLMHGGDYWQAKTDANFGDASEKAKPVTTGDTKNLDAATNRRSEESSQSSRPFGTKAIVGIVAAIAATVLAVVALFPDGNPIAKPSWGFTASGILEAPLNEPQMLAKLSEASLAWFNKVPANSEQLETRLLQFDVGCQELLAAKLPQLSDAKRKLVHQACEDCRAAIAKHLTNLKDGGDFDTVLLNADNTINRLSDEIQKLI